MDSIKLFESKKVRSQWDTEKETWFFSIIDVIEILTDSPRPRKYWSALKNKLQIEGSELSQFLGQLKMEASDGKMRETDEAQGLSENAKASKKGGKIAKDARLNLEGLTGKKVVTNENFLPPGKKKDKLE